MNLSDTESLGLELHGARTGNCFRAAIGLEEAGLPYTVRRVELSKNEQRSPAHLALNPAGKVPVLVVRSAGNVGDLVLTQSSAILFYAADLAPARLLPRHGAERLRALEAFFYFTSDVIALNGAAFTLQQGFPDAAGTLTARYCAAIEASERFLSVEGFMGSASFSIADIAACTIVSAVRASLSWNRIPKLAAWFALMEKRPSVQRGLHAFDLVRES
jgi:GST-like protein